MTKTAKRLLAFVALSLLLGIGALFALDWSATRIIANPTLRTSTWIVGEPPLQNVLTLEVAETYEQTRRGLMDRDNIGDHDGMAFPRDGKEPAQFWMHGTKIPLDIVYVDTNGRVDKVVQGKPFDKTPLPASKPTSLVIEVPAGRAKLYGLKPGAPVREKPAK